MCGHDDILGFRPHKARTVVSRKFLAWNPHESSGGTFNVQRSTFNVQIGKGFRRLNVSPHGIPGSEFELLSRPNSTSAAEFTNTTYILHDFSLASSAFTPSVKLSSLSARC